MAYFKTKEGVELFYQYSPTKNKPTLIFIHGLAGNNGVWRGYVNHFKNDFGVLSFDLRGHNKSSCAQNYRIQDFSSDINSLIKHLKIKEYFLFGYSLGGLIVSDYVNRYKAKPKGIVLISPLFDYGDLSKSFWIKFKLATLFPQFTFKLLVKLKFLFVRNVFSYISSLAKTSHQAIFEILNNLKTYGEIKNLNTNKPNTNKLVIIAEKDQIIKNGIKNIYSNYVSVNNDHLAIIKEDKGIIKMVGGFLKSK